MFRLTLCLSLLLLFCLTASSTVMAADVKQDRPKIGLALSGGGARGAAHVGVIKVLEKLQIPIDYIAGTSMGSVVGGLYASGMTSSEIEHQLATIDWDGVFDDKPTRLERSQRRKSDDVLYLFKGKVGVSENGLSVPNAAVQGQKFDILLKELTLPVASIKNFDDLPIPYRAVAMDIATGDEVVLSSGDLSIAMHASMAIPAAFAPIEINGRLLVDGGSANNLPISVVRDMGAEIVIAIDISTPLLKKEDLTGALRVIDQLAGLLTSRNVAAQVKTLTKDDVLVIPELGTISTMGFDRVLDAVEAGEKKAAEMELQLSALSINDTAYEQYRTSHAPIKWDEPVIAFVRFENNSSLRDDVLKEHFSVRPGDPLNRDEIEQGLGTLYGLEVFQTVKYDILTEGDETGVIINAKQKAWGTDSIQGGIELASDLGGESEFNIGLAYTMLPINDLNGEWRSGFQIGEDTSFFTEIYQPLDPANRYFTAAAVTWTNETVRLYDDQNSPAEAEYDVEKWELNAALGRNFGNVSNVRVGLNRTIGDSHVAVGAPMLKSFDFDDGYYFVKGLIDTMDDLDFPRSGTYTSLEWKSAHESLGADAEYSQVNFRTANAKSWHEGTIIAGARFGSTVEGDADVYNVYRLGGFLELSGLENDQLTGAHSGLITLGYQHRVYHSQIFPIYAGAMYQAGNTWQDEGDIKFDNMLSSGSLYMGIDSPLGPFYFGYGQTEGGEKAIYFYLGQPYL